jgi:hypothetical protein
MSTSGRRRASREPRWPAALAIITMFLLVVSLPTQVKLFPAWLPYVAVSLMLVPMAGAGAGKSDSKWFRIERVIILGVVSIIGIIAIATMSVIIHAMLTSSAAVSGLALLASSVTLWVTNIVVASLLYWQLDRGGPDRRAHGAGIEPDWQFPRDEEAGSTSRPWAPAYVDYLFLAFTTATAFSPTDTVPLTARAKMLMLIQALLSLVTMVIVAARAVGELGP